jgi:hypothetical protein
MEIEEYLNYRVDLLNEAKDEEGFLSESSFLSCVLPLMLDSKLIDSEDCNDSYYINKTEKIKVNGYSVNESGERLQLYIVNEDSLSLIYDESNVKISLKSFYDAQFGRAIKFIQQAIKGELNDELQDADGIKVLTSQISSSEGLEQFDVVEIFLISATATIDNRGTTPQPKRIDFDNEKIKVSYIKERVKVTKEILFIKKLVDLNFLYSVIISQGNREPLTVDFEKLFNYRIEAIKAADEDFFESYLCVLPGDIISELYKEYSTRMLEKNVRSFLQFPKKGVNSGMKDTIIDYPEKFIAFNNGLTITSTGKEIVIENGKIFIKSLIDFQIVNGGQTTATIFFTKKEGISVDKVKVMAKINVAKKATEEELDKLITDISTFSNAQSRVSKVDLRARSIQLVKIKSLSESVVTPKGVKWFFERAKGELNTAIRKYGNKERVLKKYPKERRFTKEDLAKYYTAWGNRPFLVKLGGEKVFRDFIEEINPEVAKKKAPVINRYFYENLISRIILFRNLEKIYGDGKNKIGNLRAAVIPYSISILYNRTDGSEMDIVFDLNRIWNNEGLESDLGEYFYALMKLMNDLIKKYSTSDDPSENSKTKELWERISESIEIANFNESLLSKKTLKKFTISKAEYKARLLKNLKTLEVDFKLIQDNVYIHSNGIQFYKKIYNSFQNFTHVEKEQLDTIISILFKHLDLDQKSIDNERNIINKVLAETPEIFDEVVIADERKLQPTLDYIIDIYNTSINNQEEVLQKFIEIHDKAKSLQIKNSNIWVKLGELLTKGESPKLSDIIFASSFLTHATSDIEVKEKTKIDESLMVQMVEWDSRRKILTNNERQYLSEYAYGFKKLNSFHENIVRTHLQKLTDSGFIPK